MAYSPELIANNSPNFYYISIQNLPNRQRKLQKGFSLTKDPLVIRFENLYSIFSKLSVVTKHARDPILWKREQRIEQYKLLKISTKNCMFIKISQKKLPLKCHRSFEPWTVSRTDCFNLNDTKFVITGKYLIHSIIYRRCNGPPASASSSSSVIPDQVICCKHPDK